MARIVAGGFGGVLAGLSFSIIGDNIPEERRGAATGTVMSAFGVSSVIGIPFGLFLAETFNWHAPFIFLTLLAIPVLVMVAKEMAPMNAHLLLGNHGKSNPIKNFKEVLLEPNHVRAFLLSIFIILSGFMVIPFVSAYMVKNVGLKETELTYMYFFGGLFTLVTSRYIGRLSDIHGKHKMFYVIGILSMVPILLLTNLPALPLVVVLTVSTLFFILVSGRFVPIMSLVTSSVKANKRGAFMSLNSSIQSMAMGLASMISGVIITSGASGELVNYNIVGIISCLLTIICLFLARRVKIVN
jgi:predicted MFS family arabinose efflux permease